MDQLPDFESLLKEERINLALQAIKKPQELSVQRAAIVYNMLKATL